MTEHHDPRFDLPDLIRDFVEPEGSTERLKQFRDEADAGRKLIDVTLESDPLLAVVQFALTSKENRNKHANFHGEKTETKRYFLKFPGVPFEIQVHGEMLREQLEGLADFARAQQLEHGTRIAPLTAAQKAICEANLSQHFASITRPRKGMVLD